MDSTSKQANSRSFEKYKEAQLENSRRAIITKANAIIQNTRYSLSLQEQKIVLFIMSKIRPTDTYLTEYKFNTKEFCEVCGITATNYDDIKDCIVNIKRKSFWIDIGVDEDDDTESCVEWFDTIRTSKRCGVVRMKFYEDLFPFLVELRKNFTSYSLYPILVMKSRYSVRLYELLKSYSNLTEWTFELEDFKRKMDANYNKFNDVRRRVLDISTAEINKFTDLEISYDPIKDYSRSYNRIRFFIAKKAPFFVLQANEEVAKGLKDNNEFSKGEGIQ